MVDWESKMSDEEREKVTAIINSIPNTVKPTINEFFDAVYRYKFQ